MTTYHLDDIIKSEVCVKSFEEKKMNFLRRMSERIYEKRPLLFEVLHEKGDYRALEYVRRHQKYSPSEIYTRRKQEIVSAIFTQTKKVLGKTAANGISARMRRVNFVPTTDHHGPLSHPSFASSNIVLALAASESNSDDMSRKWILTLDSSSVSLNNHSYPRGLLFHARDGRGVLREHRIPLLPKRKRMAAVYAVSPFGKQDIIRAKEAVVKKTRRGEIGAEIGEKLFELLKEIYSNDDVLGCASFSDQITKTNYHLWKRFPMFPMTEMVRLDLERLVRELLVEHHIERSDSLIARLLFDKGSRKRGCEFFDDITGSYSIQKKTGTMFFWLIEKERRQQLMIVGNSLASIDGKTVIPLIPEAVSGALRDGRLIPNLLMDFLLLAGYHGLNCFGGFSQVDYLTVMMERWRLFLNAIDEEKEAEINTSVPTKTFYGDRGLAFLADGEKQERKWMSASAMDFILHAQEGARELFAEKARSISLAESIILNFPELYRIIRGGDKEDYELLSLTQSDIISILGLEEKIFKL